MVSRAGQGRREEVKAPKVARGREPHASLPGGIAKNHDKVNFTGRSNLCRRHDRGRTLLLLLAQSVYPCGDAGWKFCVFPGQNIAQAFTNFRAHRAAVNEINVDAVWHGKNSLLMASDLKPAAAIWFRALCMKLIRPRFQRTSRQRAHERMQILIDAYEEQ